MSNTLFGFIASTIETEVPRELAFLASYDTTKKVLQNLVDMPDRKIDLFIQCCLQNDGRLSPRKRSTFSFLSDVEIQQLEIAVARGYDNPRTQEAIAVYRAEATNRS